MEKVVSADGTSIAYERSGDGPPVILVAGALCHRAMTRPLAERLTARCSVINYDRRGRGDSGDTRPYAVEREIEDIGALIAVVGGAGGTASVYGHSSGAGLALRAAAQGLPIAKLVLHEPPYVPAGEEQRQRAHEFAEKLGALLAADRRGDAVEYFLNTVGMPPELVDQLSHDPGVVASAPTIAHDFEIMGDGGTGGPNPAALAGAVRSPALVLSGGASPPWMIEAGAQIADALPNGRHRVLEGQDHIVLPETLAPVLVKFFTG